MPQTAIQSDMAQFFDFGEAALPDMVEDLSDTVSAPTGAICSIHGQESISCLCLREQHTLTEEHQPHGEAEFNTDFSSWLPRYQKPVHPCDYCRSKSLECFIYSAGSLQSNGCSPCNALFRPCSFSDPDKVSILRSKTAIDTLDLISEDSAHLVGGRTGRKPMRSLGHVGPIEEGLFAHEASKRGAGAARFPRAAVKILKEWMLEHIDHPYPTEEQKEALKVRTGLTVGQISNWMANTRRRQKQRPKRTASPSIRPSTEPMSIPPGKTWDSMNPLERWKHSPPENEPAPLTAIAQAVETFDAPELSSSSTSYTGRKGNSNDSASSFSVLRAPSTTGSLETTLTHHTRHSSGSSHSHGTAWSYGSRNSLGSLNSLNSQNSRRRRRKMPIRAPKAEAENEKRIWQCTFCCDRFKSKYDWTRHEQSLHLSLVKWICAPLGEVITCSASGQRKCVYCDALDPSKEHLAKHNHSDCEAKGFEARTFYRKDHLRQHLRLMHDCKMTPSMETWKSEVQYIKSRCGFCGTWFTNWKDRAEHLTKEFRNGATMKDWKGCRGLDSHVAANVTNAMPPYLIANESKSPFPFSASNSASMKPAHLHFQEGDIEFLIPTPSTTSPTNTLNFQQPHDSSKRTSSSSSPIDQQPTPPQESTRLPKDPPSPTPHPNATCWEILTLRLGKFARCYIEQHGTTTLTDDILQAQARLIIYDIDDPWNQTSADNPEWLALFKKAHGIGDSKDMPYRAVASQHDILEDLGLGPNAQLDKSFSLKNFESGVCGSEELDQSGTSGLPYECSLTGGMNLTQAARQYLMEWGGGSDPLGSVDPLPGVEASISELMCTQPGGVCIGENGEIGFGMQNRAANGPRQAYFLDPFAAKAATCAPVGESEPSPTSLMSPTVGQQQDMLSAVDTVPMDYTVSAATGLSTSMPVSMGPPPPPIRMTFDDSILHTTTQDSQLVWDDNDPGLFAFDMDLDLDFNADDILGRSH